MVWDAVVDTERLSRSRNCDFSRSEGAAISSVLIYLNNNPLLSNILSLKYFKETVRVPVSCLQSRETDLRRCHQESWDPR
jgi:hypothetical protein